MRKLLIITLCLFVYSVNAQEKLLEFKNSLKTSYSDIKDVIPIVNKENGDISIFIADAKNVYGYKFNENFKPVDSLSSVEKRRKYKTIIGNSISKNGDYIIFLTNKDKNKFLVTNFSFSNKKSTSFEFRLNESEKFIQTVSYNNRFYLISGNKPKGILYLNTFDDEGKMIKNKIDIKGLSIIDSYDRKSKITDLLINYSRAYHFQKIEENTPNAIESVADSRKMYIKGSDIVFTFDGNKKTTQVFTLNIETFEATHNSFNKPLTEINSTRKKTNSFINNDKIFTIAGTKEIFVMHILDYKTGKLLKEYTVTRNEKIAFKNSPIIQEGGMYAPYRELGKTKKFLRKITAGKIGISVIKNNQNYVATIGGFVEQQSAGMPMMGGFGGFPIGAVGGATIFFNPTAFAYNSFSNTKSTRIECKFDENFNHVEGEITQNAFDKIQENKISMANSKSKTIFKYKNYYVEGYYITNKKKYFLRKFTN